MRNVLPTIKQLKLALDSLDYASEVKAALHLGLPVSEIVGVGATKTAKGWSWRGSVLEIDGDVASSVINFIRVNSRPTDVFLDLDAPQVSWLKIDNSGSRKVAFGSDILFSGPLLLGDASLKPEDFKEALLYWQEHRDNPLTLTTAKGTSLVIDSDAKCWFLRNASTIEKVKPLAKEEADLDEVGADIAQELNAKLVGFLRLGQRDTGLEIEYHFSLSSQDQNIVIPVILTGNSVILGVQSHDLLDPLDWAEIEGWVWRGWDRWSNSKIAEHSKSGILARFP